MASSDTVTISSDLGSAGASAAWSSRNVEGHRLRELRRAAEAAEAAVELAAGGRRSAWSSNASDSGAPAPRPPTAVLSSIACAQLLGLLDELVAPVAPGVVDRVQEAHEAGHALAVVMREVGAAEERPAVGVEEDGHRPAALPGHRLDRLHVDGVDVGPLLAVDLHVDEAVVHHRGDVVVLERLVGHHVAPVARRVADRQEDRLVLRPGPARTPPRPTGTSRPGCRRAGAGTGWSRRRAVHTLQATACPAAATAVARAPAVVGLARRRAHDRVDDDEVARRLVRGDVGPGVRGEVVERGERRPAARCTTATTRSPQRSSGTPTTTASNTASCDFSADSTSSGYTFSPPVLIDTEPRPSSGDGAVVLDAGVVAGHRPPHAVDHRERGRGLLRVLVVPERARGRGGRACRPHPTRRGREVVVEHGRSRRSRGSAARDSMRRAGRRHALALPAGLGRAEAVDEQRRRAAARPTRSFTVGDRIAPPESTTVSGETSSDAVERGRSASTSGRANASPTITRNVDVLARRSARQSRAGSRWRSGEMHDGAAGVQRAERHPVRGAVHERARGQAAPVRGRGPSTISSGLGDRLPRRGSRRRTRRRRCPRRATSRPSACRWCRRCRGCTGRRPSAARSRAPVTRPPSAASYSVARRTGTSAPDSSSTTTNAGELRAAVAAPPSSVGANSRWNTTALASASSRRYRSSSSP